MDERVLAKYLRTADLTEAQIRAELLKYRTDVSEGVILRSYRKWIVYNKRLRDIRNKKLRTGFAVALDFINTKVEEGQ